MRFVRRCARAVALAAMLAALGGCVVVSTPFGGGDDALHETTVRGEGKAKILWLPISGFISDAPGSRAFGLMREPSTLARVSRALDKATKDDDIAAVVLRIESPGGTVAAADELYARIRRYHEETGVPVVASLGGVAASGGYYVALSADTIVAQPTTVTGSIGVILMGVNAAGLMHKLGIENQTFTSGAHKDILSPLRGATDEEREIVQSVVDSLFARFVTVLETSRPDLATDQIDRITDGRIFTADQARELGLIDDIGHIDDALADAERVAGVDSARVIRYYRGRSAPHTLAAQAAAGVSPQLSLRAGGAPIDVSFAGAPAGVQPMYLWRPDTLR